MTKSAAVVELTKRYGWRRTIWLLQFLASWTIALADNDWEPISAEDYATYWRISRAKGYRDLQKWRRIVPDEHTPTDRVLAARPDIERMTAGGSIEQHRDDVAALLAVSPAA